MADVSVQSLCSLITSGGTPNRARPEYYTPGNVPWVKTGDLRDSSITTYDEYISSTGLMNSSAKILPKHTILMAMYGATVGRLGWLSEPASCNQAACALVADSDRCDWRWLFYALMWTRDSLVGLASGAAQQNLNAGTIRAARLPGLDLLTQQAVAEVLGALDDKIAANERVNHAAEAVVVALVESASETTVVAELATQSTQSVSPNGFDERVAHFSLPSFDDGGRPDLAAASSIKSNKFLIDRPTVLISKLNPRIQRVWDVIKLPDQMALASTEFVVLHPVDLSTSALWGALRQPSVTAALGGMVAGTSGSHQRVRPAEILQLRVPDPRSLGPGVLQRIDSLGRLIHAVRVESVRLAATRDELLPLLMSGRLRVKDAEKAVKEVV